MDSDATNPSPRYREALAAIWERSGYDRGYISNPFAGDEAARRGLARTRRLLDRLGAPDAGLAIVHVAGSKGKGSTCAFVDAVARAAGYRVGRYTSPHLHQFRERIAVDGNPIAEADFADALFATLAAAKAAERDDPALGETTAFELTTAMALAVFSAHACELAVVEVGLGGALDATNVVAPRVSLIAPLDYEHTAVLGSTLAEIARNKAGIIKPGRPVAVAAQPAEALAVIEARAREQGSPLLLADRDWGVEGTWQRFTATGPWGRLAGLRSSLIGGHQVQNAGLALAACALLAGDGFTFGEDAVRRGLASTAWPGRFEVVVLASGQHVVIDGAHTPAAARALAAALEMHAPGTRAEVVLGLLRGKSPAAFIEPLLPVAERWHLTAPAGPRALPAGELATALAPRVTLSPVAGSVAEAVAGAIAGGAVLIVVTGSLATAAEARVALGLAIDDPMP